MDLETLFTTVYVLVDDWYKEEMQTTFQRRIGAPPKMSDSEVLCVAVLGQWRLGVPWQSERGLVRYLQAHGRALFPTMLQRSAFNRRVRCLWGAFVLLQQHVAALLDSPDYLYECVDTLPLPALSNGQAQHQSSHWLWQSRRGLGAYGSFFWGDQLLLSVQPSGAITGWLVGTADLNDRWLLEAFLSARAGEPRLVEPARRTRDAYADHTPPPVGFIGGFAAVGQARPRPYLADRGFNGRRWLRHWWHGYQATVIAVPMHNEPPTWSREWKRWLASHRQIIETTFAWLDGIFGIKRLNAHSRWGQYTRLAAKTAAYNIGLYINRLLGRPTGALATLLC
jgi:Transposase DDE domain